METRRKLDDEEKKGISKCDDCDFCSPGFNWCSLQLAIELCLQVPTPEVAAVKQE